MPRLEQILRPTQRLRHHLDPTASLPAAPRHCDNARVATPKGAGHHSSARTPTCRLSRYQRDPGAEAAQWLPQRPEARPELLQVQLPAVTAQP